MQRQARLLNPNLRLLCSYGGRIMPFTLAKSLQYIGGETHIVTVPRSISFSAFFKLLSSKLLSGGGSFSFILKYRLPGYDLDSLITVDNNEDLQNMITEYDSAGSGRIRLFLFPLDYPESTPCLVSVNQLLGLELPEPLPGYSSRAFAPAATATNSLLRTSLADAGTYESLRFVSGNVNVRMGYSSGIKPVPENQENVT